MSSSRWRPARRYPTGAAHRTAGQSDDLLGDYANQVRVVLGSPATGIGDVAEAIRPAADVGDRFTVPTIGNRRQFEVELVAGRPGERRVVLTDLVALAPRDAACTDALTAALTRRPHQPGVTRSAVSSPGRSRCAYGGRCSVQAAAPRRWAR